MNKNSIRQKNFLLRFIFLLFSFLLIVSLININVDPEKIYPDKILVNIREFEKKINPEYSVPVQLILGKIKKVNKLYLPELKLAFLENDKKYLILNRDLDIKR